MQSLQHEVLPGRAWHQLNDDRPVLSIVVNEVGGYCEARLDIDGRNDRLDGDRRRKMGHTSLIPGGLPIWGYSEAISRVDEIRLILDADRAMDVMGGEFPVVRLGEPHLMFFDESLQATARLLATSQDDLPGFTLLGDSLVTAIIARFSQINMSTAQSHRRLGLTKRQLTRVTDFMRENFALPIGLTELAALAELSPSQFIRAFKVSTGVTPHKWYLEARIDHAKRMLMDRRNSLVDIALDNGFSEQSPFTRAFRAVTGTSPGAWRRSRLN